VERVKQTIAEIETDIRGEGVFLLVDVNGRKLWAFGYKKDKALLDGIMESLKPRRDEMIRFLIARARAQRGETT
jgi:hypothetical protein